MSLPANSKPIVVEREAEIGTSAEPVGAPIELANWGASLINFEATIVDADMASFALQLKDHPHGEWYDFLQGSDFDTVTETMRFASSNKPPGLTDGQKAHVHARINAAYAVRFVASADAAGSTVTVRAALRGT